MKAQVNRLQMSVKPIAQRVENLTLEDETSIPRTWRPIDVENDKARD